MSENEKYQFSGKVVMQTYRANDFAIYAVNVDSKKYPEIQKHPNYKTVSIVGNLPDLSKDVEYEISAIEQSTKYGISYKVLHIRRDVPTTFEDTYLFLTEVLTPRQAESLYKAYPDIIQRVRENRLDDIDLSKVKGVKEKSFSNIKEKIISNFCLADLVVEFQGYLSLNVIKKIYDKYSSVELLREKLKEDPYKCLVGISRVGFKIADKLLLDIEKSSKQNVKEGKKPIIYFESDLKSSPQRCLAYVLFALEENEGNGNTKMNLIDLRANCIKDVPDCAEHFVQALKDDSIYYNKETLDVALKSTYNTEKYIADRILDAVNGKQNVWNYDIEKYRNVDGSELSDEQMCTLKYVCENQITILTAAGGCVDCDTEFFDGVGWKRIADYKIGDKVLQYNKNGTAELVYPQRYVKHKAEYLWHFATKYGLDQCLSDNHNVYYLTRNNVLYNKPFKEIREKQISDGFTGRFITTFNYNGNGIDLTDVEIRLMIATFADGSFYRNEKTSKYYTQARFHVKKDRKMERLLMLAQFANRKFRVINSAIQDYFDIYIDVPFRSKHYPIEWYNCSKHQLEVIADEVMFWDGDYKRNNCYSTNFKKDADFIQFVYSALGYRATISTRNRVSQDYLTCGKTYKRKSIEYSVLKTSRNLIAMCSDKRPNYTKTPIEKYKTKDGFEYCFTVPSHMLVLRRNDKIFITGNCGKSYSSQAVINMLKDHKLSYGLMSPTGKAAKVLSEYTKEQATTIHRGLRYSQLPLYYKNGAESDSKSYDYRSQFQYNRYNKLNYDIVIVDECSMIDCYLFKDLLEALDLQKTKLLLIGDSYQISSVGSGNILNDFIESKVVPTVKLTKVFRYSDGGLMKVATDVRLGKPYLDNSMRFKATKFGNNKDYMYIDLKSETIATNTVSLYKKLLNNGENVSDIQVLSAKNVGECGSIMLNNMIQAVVNKNYGSETNITIGNTTYYKDDAVIQVKNNYRAKLSKKYLNEKEYKIFEETGEVPTVFLANGETAYIVDINKNGATLNFDGTYVDYSKAEMSEISLAYVISIHRSQGSGFKNVIIVTPRQHTWMLNSNLLYTALTRTKNRCYHLGSLNTVNQAVVKKANLERHTFMQQLLKGGESDGQRTG